MQGARFQMQICQNYSGYPRLSNSLQSVTRPKKTT